MPCPMDECTFVRAAALSSWSPGGRAGRNSCRSTGAAEARPRDHSVACRVLSRRVSDPFSRGRPFRRLGVNRLAVDLPSGRGSTPIRGTSSPTCPRTWGVQRVCEQLGDPLDAVEQPKHQRGASTSVRCSTLHRREVLTWYRRGRWHASRVVQRQLLGLLFAVLAVGFGLVAVFSALEGGSAWIIALAAAALALLDGRPRPARTRSPSRLRSPPAARRILLP